MRAPLAAALALLSLALAGCTTLPGDGPSTLTRGIAGLPLVGEALLPAPTFGPETTVDAALGGTEPSLVVDAQGRIFVAAPTGLANGERLSGQFWRSADGGASFEHLPGLGVAGLYGPSIGGGDSDIAADAQGNLYAIDLWLGNTGLLVSEDHGDSWLRGSPITFLTPGNDRQWVEVNLATGEVYIAVNSLSSGLWVIKSADAGLTFPQQSLAVPHADRGGCICPPGAFTVDEVTGNIYLPYYLNPGGVGVATSTDGGSTFTLQVVPGSEDAHLPDDDAGELGGAFTVITHDTHGNLYLAWEQPTAHGRRVVLQTSQDQGVTWSEPLRVADMPRGQQVFPWVAAGEPGRVAVAFYEVGADEAWDARLALGTNALEAFPVFREAVLNQEPLHTGAYDRGLFGDFFEVALGPDGRIHAVFNAMRDGSPTLLHVQQLDGPLLLTGASTPAPAAAKPLKPSVPQPKPVAPQDLAEELAAELGLPPP
jgi:hypothetical protein